MIRAALLFLMSVALPPPPEQPRPRIISQQVYIPERCNPNDPLPCQAVIVQIDNPLADPVTAVVVCENKINAAVVTLPARMRVLSQIEIVFAVHGAAPCFVYSYAR